MNNKNFSDTIEELKNITTKLNDPNTNIEDSIELFKKGTELIKVAKIKLESIEGEVKKVIDENSEEDFK